jgi:hypothetical protein
MANGRWLDHGQPQTLQSAVLLLYITAAFDFLQSFGRFGAFEGLVLLLVAGKVAAGWGVSNEKSWGYIVGVVIAILAVLPLVAITVSAGLSLGALLYYAFDIVLVVLLLHPQSREYQRIWFR